MDNKTLFMDKKFSRYFFSKSSNGVINVTKKSLNISEYLLSREQSTRNILKYFPSILLGLSLTGYCCQFLIQYLNPYSDQKTVNQFLLTRAFYATLAIIAFVISSIHLAIAISLSLIASICNLYFDLIDIKNNYQLLQNIKNPNTVSNIPSEPFSEKNRKLITLALEQKQHHKQLKQLLAINSSPEQISTIEELLTKMLQNHHKQRQLQAPAPVDTIDINLLRNDIYINGISISLSIINLSITLCCMLFYANLSLGLASLMLVFFTIDTLGLMNNVWDFYNQDQLSQWQKQKATQQSQIYLNHAGFFTSSKIAKEQSSEVNLAQPLPCL